MNSEMREKDTITEVEVIVEWVDNPEGTIDEDPTDNLIVLNESGNVHTHEISTTTIHDVPTTEANPLSVKAMKNLVAACEENTDAITIAVDEFLARHNCINRCTDEFSRDEIIQLRCASLALDEYVDGTNRLDLVILATIRVLLRRKYCEASKPCKRSVDGNIIKRQCSFMIEGHPVCKAFFHFIHNISEKRWRRLLKTYHQEGLVERKHGLCNRKPSNTLPLDVTQNVVQFIRNYAAEHALCTPNRRNPHCYTVKVLPTGETKATVYKKYKEALLSVDPEVKPISRESFCRIWRLCCPDIVARPRLDLFVKRQPVDTETNIVTVTAEDIQEHEVQEIHEIQEHEVHEIEDE